MTLPLYLRDHQKKVLIFDFDHTLMRLDLPWDMYRQHIKELLISEDTKLYASLPKKISTFEKINIFVRKHGDTFYQKSRQWGLQFETECLKGVELNKDLLKFIKNHDDTYHYALWSSNRSETIEPLLEKNGLSDLFSVVMTQDRVRFFKPDPNGFDSIDRQMLKDKKDYLMVGDSKNDHDAAMAAGISFFQIKNFSLN